MFSGYFAAMVTPFFNDKLDLCSFEKYIHYLIDSGISGIVVCASTGEALSLSTHERIDLVTTAARVVNGKIKVIAGVIDSMTENCKALMKSTEDLVDGFLCICPFYIKPSQEQIYSHFRILSESTDQKLILYNNPARAGSRISFETLKMLSEQKNIIGIKDCGSDLSVFSRWRLQLHNDFILFSGDDTTACGALALGARGIISVTANVAPKMCAQIYRTFKRGDVEGFRYARDILAPLHSLMFDYPSPAPAKYMLSRLGLIKNELRSPLSPVDAGTKAKIDDFMEEVDIT
ncbi:MAG: 4-hydroxy-tetrahydrodipicolinate synthase [Holosporaceae bacterium]|jgi:4-hydroxy-tetrahydrodipicolinate synthase|nr:4-hydroxy-tetrahydrodipicolinate synthase [Holosporaceae bacterium]